MPLQSEIDHANRDKEVLGIISPKKKYHDWVVIISFYSALHFVRAQLFPMAQNSTIFNSFNEYYIALGGQRKKHELLLDLVNTHLPQIASKYSWLFNASMTSRYSNRAVDQNEANKALLYLTAIESECKK